MTSTATHYIAERLTTVDWLLTIWPVLRRRCAGRAADGCAFYYVDATPRAARLAARMCKRIGIRAARLEFDAAQTFDPQGLLVWLKTYYRDLADALSHIEREPGFPDAPAPGDPSRYRSTYVRKQCVPGRTLVAGDGVWRSVYLTHVCLEHARRGAPPPALVIWCENQPWFAGLASYAASLGPVSLRPLGRAYRPAPFVPAVLARDLKVIGERLLRRGKREEAASQTASVPITNPTIAIQYYGQFNLDAPALHSDFFFWQRSELEGRRIVGLFGFPQDPLDARRMRELREHGMHAVALRASATTLPHAVFAKTSLVRNLARAVSIYAGIFAAPRAAWTRANVHVFEAETRYWMRLFEQTRSRVFLTWFKYTSVHAPSGEA
ncbi:MAG: hypothetical protein JWM26_292, partial [Betaproteobacteria bacterium]|nr:hypothetical protein [Betaproteobacteria bacterium]